MLIDEVVSELLLRWKDNPSLTPEELCHEYKDHPEYAVLLEAVQRGIRELQAAASFLDTSRENSSDSQKTPLSTDGWTAPPETPSAPTAPGLRYRPVSFHAKGGLGEVFRAEDEELHREVALKRIQERHRDNAESHRRFLREAEITAKLQHPGIVPVYGLASDGDGQPCYAMRFIEGGTLDDALKRFHEAERKPGRDPGERSLALRELLTRFIAVCNTMAYAHSRGIVHRDLKPGNIMLGDYGETLVVDWGLAKPFARTEAERSTGEETLMPTADGPSEGATQLGQAMGTPAYMSPEQAEGRWDVVGPASDIFSLGATLYAVLTGQAPYRGRNPAEALSKARRGDFPPPRQVNRDVPRALEAICQKAMAFEPEQRYRTAKELAADVEQWLADQPVTAYREPLPARLWRWGRRHKTAVATGTAMVLTTLLVGIAGLLAINRAVRAEQKNTEAALDQVTAEQQKTQAALDDTKAVLNFFQDKVLSAGRPADQAGGQGIDVMLSEAVDKAEPQIAGDFKDRPLVEASIRNTLGSTYWYLGKPSLAIQQHERALALCEAQLGTDHPHTLTSRNNLANAYLDAGRAAEAIRLHEQTVKQREVKLGTDHPDTLISRDNLASAYLHAGRTNEAIRLHEQTLKQKETELGADHPDTLISRNNLALAYQDAGRTAEAIRLDEQTLKQREAKLGTDHPDTLTSRNNLANAYLSAGRTAQAIRLLEQTLKQYEAKLGVDHLNTLNSRNSLAEAYRIAGRADEAIRLHEKILEQKEAKLGVDHPDTLHSRNNLAAAYWSARKLDRSIPLLKETLKLRKAKLGADHPETLRTMANLGVNYRDAGRLKEAVPLLETALQRGRQRPDGFPASLDWVPGALAQTYDRAGRFDKSEAIYRDFLKQTQQQFGTEDPRTAGVLAQLGNNLLQQKKYTDAEATLRDCFKVREATQPDDWSTFNTRSALGEALVGQKKYTEAEPLLLEGYEGMKQRQNKIPPSYRQLRLGEALQRLVRLYEATDQKDKADTWRKKREEVKKPQVKDGAKK